MPGIEYVKKMTGYYDVTGYGWIIDIDHLAIEYPTFGDETGTMGPINISDEITALLNKGEGIPFRMYDDDGELYYSGRIIVPDDDDLRFRPLSDFGEPNAGCTEIRYQNSEDNWETL